MTPKVRQAQAAFLLFPCRKAMTIPKIAVTTTDNPIKSVRRMNGTEP